LRLAELELFGFKSFPHRTSLNFDSGITSIVGPNGCGKSNIVDSIRWVLGEQSAKSLRGDRMDSVIFSGSNNRNPGSLAEVALVIDNNHNLLANGAAQTKVTRRLYRNGESEYLLNGIPCLLRDITELFADTGIGASAYMVMEQAMVESLISEKDESRREVFDEAAGITKYKLKRKLAARKLESTEADLLRLGDLVAEVEKQVGSLKRQMRKAEGFKKLKDELKALELKVSRRQLQEITEKLNQLERLLKNATGDRETNRSELATQELGLEQLRLEHLEIEKLIEIERSGLERTANQAFKEQESISVARQKIESLKENLNRLQEEQIFLAKQKDELEQAISHKKQEALVVLDRLEKIKTENTVLQAEVSQLQKKSESSRIRLQELNEAWSAKSLAVQQAESRAELLLQRLKEINQREKELQQQLGDKQKNSAELRQRVQLKNSETAELEKSQATLLSQREKLTSRAIELERNISEQRQQLSKTQTLLAAEKSRQQVLLEVWSSYQGYQEGVRALVQHKERFGLIDTVANLLKAEETYLLAVEAALGEKASYLVAQSWDKALEAIQALKEQNWGEAGFVIAEPEKHTSENQPEYSGGLPSGMVPLSSLVKSVGEHLNGFPGVLLDKVYLVDNTNQARQLLPGLHPELVLVTLDGEVFSRAGIAKGGRKKSPALLGRQEQIQQAEQKIREWQAKQEGLENQVKADTSRIQALKQELQENYEKIEEQREILGRSQIELSESKSEDKQIQESLQIYEQEIAKLKAGAEQLQLELSQIQTDCKQQKIKLKELEADLAGQRIMVREEETRLSQASQQLNQKVVDLITLEGQKERLENDSLRLVEAISQTQINMQARKDQKEKTLHEIQQSEQAVQSGLEELQRLTVQKESQSGEVQKQAERQHIFLEQINQKESQLKIVRKSQSESQEEVHRLELSRQELESQIRQIKNKIWEEYEVDLETVPELEAKEIEQIPQYQEQINQVRQRLKSYGAVNLLALEEYQREKERLDFLRKQREDLISAKQNLQSTIARINDTARSLFLDTFEKVRLNFQQVLAGLFEGGEADLTLEPGIDPLEAKIEILAKPRGKKLVTLAQLSGGEKALVAISLLFSLYLVKPSPFCILDEVDAPLDDANIGRFVKLIRQFTERTQFVIITHNKLTMEAADALYGVTMTEPGESQIVSVRLKKEAVSS